MKLVGGRRTESPQLYLIAGALMTGGPVWHYLYVNHYPFDRAEAVVLTVVAGLLGALVGAAAHRTGGLVGGLLFGALVFAFADLQFDLRNAGYAVIVLLAAIGLSLLLRERRAAIVGITLGALYAASLPRSALAPAAPVQAQPAVARDGQPILVHIVLDEQWGVGGLRAAGDTSTAAFVSSFYLERGFSVYDAAYSRSNLTSESIPAALSLGRPISIDRGIAPYVFSMPSNPYFERLRKLGYRISVFQSYFFDYCRAADAPVAECHVVPNNSIANISNLGGRWTSRLALTGRFLLSANSLVYSRLYGDQFAARQSVTGGAFAAARSLRAAIAEDSGTKAAYFAHLLLPHRPIDVDATCRPVSLEDRVNYRTAEMPWARLVTLMGEQIRCAHLVMDDIIAAIDQSVGRDGAIVIVHGDHGARLRWRSFRDLGLSQLDATQLNSGSSTLLAVRRPGILPAVYSDPVPVQDFVSALAQQDFTGEVTRPWQHYLRRSPSEKVPTDTIRTLGDGDMPWANPPGRQGPSSPP